MDHTHSNIEVSEMSTPHALTCPCDLCKDVVIPSNIYMKGMCLPCNIKNAKQNEMI